MKKLFKPASLLLYLLTILVFFFLGLLYAGLVDAGKGQGLAAGAIVLGYGVFAAFYALLAAIFAAYALRETKVKLLNKILGIALIVVFAIVVLRIVTKAASAANAPPVQQTQKLMGLGMVKPHFFENRCLYFYGQPNLQKSVSDHVPGDSLVFKKTEHGFAISYAPPWFAPAHMKMDYETLFLRMLSIHRDFVEVVVNEYTGQKAYLDRRKVNVTFWPNFLLSVNSVKPLDPQNNPVRIKPLAHASLVTSAYTFLKPVQVAHQWIKVALLDDKLKSAGTGWIMWQKDGELLIAYSLLS
ncbi:MAG: hypothetical protein DWQ10_04710 [Calditrichaeota bacterium]|nr:MAG: hypothetical protein DWQ10_04710 [Calditrichota bacterium]